MQVSAKTPVIIGVSQITSNDRNLVDIRSPVQLMCDAAALAARDSGASGNLLPELESIAVIRSFSDTAPAFKSPFGGPANPPWSVARRIDATPSEFLYPAQGGDTPQLMATRACQQIATGAIKSALIVGAEAMATERRAVRAGVELDWRDDAPRQPDDLGGMSRLYSTAEIDHGMRSAVAMYALIEQSLRAAKGRPPAERQRELGRMFAEFADVARRNPYATRREGYAAAQISDPSAANRYVGFPYTRLMTANMYVDQAAAIILCSTGQADEWRVPADRRVYLHGAAAGHDEWFVSERRELHSSPAIKAVVSAALDMAGIDIDRISLFDLYSCFACAVEIAADEISISTDDTRGLTVTGGLPFFGGPGNNYVTHAIAEMTMRLRAQPGSFGLVTANGGLLTKQAAGVYSTRPSDWNVTFSPGPIQADIDRASGPKVELLSNPSGPATIETYTVLHGRSGPEKGIVIGRMTGSNRRFVANTPADPQTFARLQEGDAIGKAGVVSSDGTLNTFMLDPETARP